MTGFARVEKADGEDSLDISIRAVNHRFLDLKIKTSSEFEASDGVIRGLVQRAVRRGHVQVSIELRSAVGGGWALNRELAAAYLAAHEQLARLGGSDRPLDPSALLRVPGMVIESSAATIDDDRRERLETLLRSVLAEALRKLNAERAAEGAGIAAEARLRTEAVMREARALRPAADDLIPALQRRLEKRVAELLQGREADPQRIVQEAALLADRADVSEELQRLEAHAARLAALLDEGGEVGKAMDFTAQEMNRETNTLLSKTNTLGAAGLAVTEAGLRLKAEIEKIREQAQNLE